YVVFCVVQYFPTRRSSDLFISWNVEIMAIEYGGYTLPDNLVNHLQSEGESNNVPPSLFISQLYYESNWGSSSVAKNNNNWGGLRSEEHTSELQLRFDLVCR